MPESNAVWAQRLIPNADWDKTLERRGPNAVRELLHTATGAGAGAVVGGLGDHVDEQPSRVYAENWLDKKDAAKAKRELGRQVLTWSIAFLALCASAGSMVAAFREKSCVLTPSPAAPAAGQSAP